MNGWSYDYLLALDDINCEQRGKGAASIQSSLDQYATEQFASAGTAYSDFFTKHGGNSNKICSYVNWAYIESVDL